MTATPHYDYIILGGGLSGLMLAYRFSKSPRFREKRILIIDRSPKTENDRTWCFWAEPGGMWDDILTKTWENIFFGHPEGGFQKISLKPLRYNMLRGIDLYRLVREEIDSNPNVESLVSEVMEFNDRGDAVHVKTVDGNFTCDKLFNSKFDPKILEKQHRYDVLQQHFVGWFVQTKTPKFKADTATFMDFSIPQRGNTRFMYILPISETEALFEYTLFSKELLPTAVYEAAIKDYLVQNDVIKYTIAEKERGRIPMTCYPFERANTNNILHIGTAGGWTKPSTGFTFSTTVKQTEKLIAFLQHETNLKKFAKRSRFWYYDLLFLDVLARKNGLGASLFSRMFRRNDIQHILRFLDNESSPREELKLILSLPPGEFLRAVVRKLKL